MRGSIPVLFFINPPLPRGEELDEGSSRMNFPIIAFSLVALLAGSPCVLAQAADNDLNDGEFRARIPAAAVDEPAPLALLPSLVDVELRLERNILPVGSPVIGEFVIRNKTLDPITLQVPGTVRSARPFPAMGLPLEHVFSGDRFRALRIVMEGDESLGDRISVRPDAPVPTITLAPLASVGLRFDLTLYYPILRQAGRYEIQWAPYSGSVTTGPIIIEVVTYKMVVLETDQGRLTLRLMYDKAPKTVANFLELVDARFYDGLSLHRIEPGFVIAGGCPRGDGTGRRSDGRTLAPEFNDTPFTAGTVGMSLATGDPFSASCQFFIALSRLEYLDRKYTAFAQVEGPESMETLRKIAAVETDRLKRPVKPLTIKTAVIIDAPRLR
jgi:cyclophilin family peptidyl-prolyl cis-trans isomerase